MKLPCLIFIAGLLAVPQTTRAQSVVQITNVTRTASGVRLQWAGSEPNTSFTIQRRDALTGGLWITDRHGSPGPIGDHEWTAETPGNVRSGFFRVGAVATTQRGQVITNTILRDFSQGELAFLLSLNGIPVTPATGVRVRKIVYETLGPAGARSKASGVLAVPSSITQPLPLVSYQHGTLVTRSDSPSTNLYGETMVGVIYASLGYAAVVPDYLGFGESPDYHPYHHAASTATACVDMLRAARAVCAQTGVVLTNRLFLCGYSQGGHATMALHRELETYHAAEFTVTASAPMAGAYDLSGTTASDFLSGRAMPNPYYFVYLLASYQSTYHLADSLASLLAPPYQTTLPPLMDGRHTSAEINAAMPSVPTRILKPEVLDDFRTNSLNVLRLALRDNDAFSWPAQAPIRLFHCSGDQDVSPLNSQVALGTMPAAGARSVEFVEPSPGATHGGCSMPALLAAKAWFDTMK